MPRRPARTLSLLLSVLGVVLVATLAPATQAGATGTDPVVQRDVIPAPPFGAVGTEVALRGVGWEPNTLISVSLCGNLFLNGTSDCAPSASNTTTTLEDGTFFTDIVVALPPVPCPCVIHASGVGIDATVNKPFVVEGAEVNPNPTAEVIRRDVDLTASLEGSGPLLAYFGGSAQRTYTLTVKNTGTRELTDPPITVAVGEGADPTDIVARPKLGTLTPGAETTVEIPITIDGPTFGRYTVKTTIAGIDVPLSVSESTTSYPWALFVVAWLLLQIPLLGLYRRRRLDGPDDPLDREFESLLMPAPDYGVGSVRDFVEPHVVTVPEDDPPTRVVVSGNGGTRRPRSHARASSGL